MPQMMPMNWLNLYIYSLTLIFLMLILIYFMKYNNMKKIKINMKKKNNLLIKW